MNDDDKHDVALWRFAVLGPLVYADLAHGQLRKELCAAADRVWHRPDGRRVRLAVRTIEDWYYAYKKNGLQGLRPSTRQDAGASRVISPEVADRILLLKRENMRRSVRRIIRILEREKVVRRGQLKRSTVHRLLAAHDISHREVRGVESDERRAFRPPHAGMLWMGDVAHGPKVLANGKLRKAYLHVFLDAAVRFVVGARFLLGETALDHQIVLKEAVRRYGKPNVLYLDLGAAQTAKSLKLICAELGVQLLHCRPRDPEAKAGVERFFRTMREEVLDELPDGPVTLDELNSKLWAWLSVEYHDRVHDGTGQRPMPHWLSEVDRLRPAPDPQRLDEIFLHRVSRKVRKDTTVRFQGRILEVRPELCGKTVELRYDPDKADGLPKVFVDGVFACDTVELDLVRNASRRRRRRKPAVEETTERSGADALGLMQDEQARKCRPSAPGVS